jgi:hypothetical protein
MPTYVPSGSETVSADSVVSDSVAPAHQSLAVPRNSFPVGIKNVLTHSP